VEVSQVEGERTIILELRVNPDDMGKIIGKQGRIAQAVRTLMKAKATKEGRKIHLEII
jgi:predicted RNA-binding protein YlqC (UPF0109 family)